MRLIKFIIALFCNINPYYYFRHFFFAVALSTVIILNGGVRFQLVIMVVVCTLLYPYSRFVYEAIIDIIIGNNLTTDDNTIVINVTINENESLFSMIFRLCFKVITMAFCFCFSPFIAPIGLLWLYFLQRKKRNSEF